MPDPSCPACGAAASTFVETHRDRVSDTSYTMRRCTPCGLVFADPRRSVGADWYASAVPDEPVLPPEADWRFLEFLADAPPGARVLDVGCGDGQFLRLASKRGHPGVGFDWDDRRVARARATGLDASAVDWEKFLAGRSEEFGAAVLFDVLEHVPEPAALLRGLRQALLPGGLLALTVPNEARPLPFGREDYDYPPHHFTRWTRSAMKSLLEREGFSVIRQDASMREIFYFRDVMTAQLAFKPAAGLVRRLLRRGASPAAGGHEISKPRSSASRGPRALLFSLYSFTAKAALWPAALVLTTWYSLTRTDPGHCLYTLARKNG